MEEKLRFAVRLAKSRWLVIVAAMWVQCTCGATYSFGIYSQTLKDYFGYDQKTLDTLASWKDLGANIGVVSGLIFDWFSPQAVLAIGAFQSVFGYLVQWLALTGRIAPLPFWQMCICTFLGANSQPFFSTACVVTCVKNFPRNRGIVIGLMKGFLGLAGAIMTQLYHGLYGNDPASYLLMASYLSAGMALLMMFIIRPVPAQKEPKENSNLYILSYIGLCLAGFLMGIILLQQMITISHDGYVIICTIMFGILLLPFGLVWKSELEMEACSKSLSTSPDLQEPLVLSNQIETSSLSDSAETVPSSNGRDVEDGNRASTADYKPFSNGLPDSGHSATKAIAAEKRPGLGEDHTILEAVMRFEFWLLVLAMGCGMGSGLSAIDNTGQIGASLGYKPLQVATFVSLFSLWNFLGRLGFGAVSEILLHKCEIGRPSLLAFSQMLMCVGHLLIAFAFPGSLYPALVIIGLCYGAQWCLMPAITSELFGLSRFATLFNIITIASPIGAYFLSVQVLGRLYDMEAAKGHQEVGKEEYDCYGASCFRWTFVVLASVSLFGFCVCALLTSRTRKFYARYVQKQASEAGS